MDFSELLQSYGPGLIVPLILATIVGVVSYYVRQWNARPRLLLSVTWKHVPASSNYATAMDWDRKNPEFYLGEFTLSNNGQTVIYLDRIEISGENIVLSELRYNDAREGRLKNAIDFPESLQAGQPFTFSHHFTKQQFRKMVEKPNFLIIGATRSHKLKIHTKV